MRAITLRLTSDALPSDHFTPTFMCTIYSQTFIENRVLKYKQFPVMVNKCLFWPVLLGSLMYLLTCILVEPSTPIEMVLVLFIDDVS